MASNTTVFEPLQGMVQGMLQGHQVAEMIRRSALEHEAMQRQVYQQERQGQIQDIQQQMLMQQYGRPVENGIVREKSSLGNIAGDVGDNIRATMPTGEGQSFEFMRKPEAGRTVKYKTQDGQELNYELKTPEEQAHEHLQQTISAKMLEGQISNKLALDKLRGENEINRIDLAQLDSGKIDPKAVPILTERERTKAEGLKQEDQQAFTAEQNKLNRENTKTISDARNLTTLKAAQLKKTGQGAGDPRLVKAVLDNPGLFDKLTPTEIGRIAPDLAAAGFGMGKPLAESAIKQMSETKSAISSLRDLRETLKQNEKYIGPVAGLQAMNPYSEARKAQAEIDLVKQRVGKALEGGVLRKEDEEKYKQILATLRDTPDTAISKVDGVIDRLEQDLKIYVDEQRNAGRRVQQPGAGQPAAAGAPVDLSKFELRK